MAYGVRGFDPAWLDSSAFWLMNWVVHRILNLKGGADGGEMTLEFFMIWYSRG